MIIIELKYFKKLASGGSGGRSKPNFSKIAVTRGFRF